MAKTQSINKSAKSPVKKALPLWQRKSFLKWLVFLFPLLLFLNSISNEYNLDDELVTINHRLTAKGMSAIPEIFASPYYQDASGYAFEYRPVVLTSFAIEHQFFGDAPHVSHFFNVIFYALCCLLLYNVLCLLLRQYSHLIPVAITLLFAAHPAHTEVVCSIKNRDEILGLLFSLLSLLFAVRYAQTSKLWALLLAPLFFAAALMSKITMISFVVIIPLALIILTQVRLTRVLLTTALLLVPTYILLIQSRGFDKLMICLGLLGFMTMFYSMVHFRKSIEAVRQVFSSLADLRLGVFSQEDFEIAVFSSIRDFFKGTIPGRYVFSFAAIIIPSGLAVLHIALIVQQHTLLAAPILFLLLVLSVFGDRTFSFWSMVMFNACLVFNLGVGQISSSTNIFFYRSWLCVFFALQLFFKRRIFTIPSLLAILSIAIFNVTRLDDRSMFFLETLVNDWSAFVLTLYILCFSKRFGKNIYTVIFFLLAVAFLAKSFQTTIPAIVVLAFCLFPYLRSKLKYIAWMCLLIAASNFYYNSKGGDDRVSVRASMSRVIVTANKISPTIISNPQDRPIEYVEEVVKSTDPQSKRLGTSFEILGYYLLKTIVPYPLSFYYGYKFIEPRQMSDTFPVISLILYLVLTLSALYTLRKEPLISFGLFLYLVSMTVFSNYFQPVPGMMADRFLLVPSIGMTIVLVALFHKTIKRSKDIQLADIPSPVRYSFVIILFLYSAATFSRNMDWKDYLTLFRHDIKYVDNSSQAHNLLAYRLMKASYASTDQTEQLALRREALIHYRRALEIYPSFFNVTVDLGQLYAVLNIPDSAIWAYDQAIKLNPDYSKPYSAVGEILFYQKKYEQAIPYYEFVLNKFPDRYSSYDRLSFIYFSLQKYDKARDISLSAIKNAAPDPSPYVALGRIYQSMNRDDSARIWLQKGIELYPGNNNMKQTLQSLKK